MAMFQRPTLKMAAFRTTLNLFNRAQPVSVIATQQEIDAKTILSFQRSVPKFGLAALCSVTIPEVGCSAVVEKGNVEIDSVWIRGGGCRRHGRGSLHSSEKKGKDG